MASWNKVTNADWGDENTTGTSTNRGISEEKRKPALSDPVAGWLVSLPQKAPTDFDPC